MTDEPLFAEGTEPTPEIAPEATPAWQADLTAEENTFLADAGLTGADAITITTSTAGTTYVPTAEPMTARDAFVHARLNPGFDVKLYVEGAEVSFDQLLQPGQTVVAIGSVKGGV